MIKRSVLTGLAILTVGLLLNHGSLTGQAECAESSTGPSVHSSAILTVHGKIVEINKDQKLLVVETPTGEKATLNVANPYNLNAVKVGDPIVARFYEVVTIRKKQAGESVPSASVKQRAVTAKPGGVPGVFAEQQADLVVSVAAVDEKNGTVTVKAPDGATQEVKAANPKNLQTLKPGDELVINLSRAMAISVAKHSQD